MPWRVLGVQPAAWLDAAGIRTRAQLRQLGPIGACRRLLEAGRPVTLALAYTFAGLLAGTDAAKLTAETRLQLRLEFEAMRRALRPGP